MRKHIQPPQLNILDRKILAILQQDNTTPQRTIGETVNLSAPAVQRRIKRMTDEGVIRANVAIIDPMAVGQSITIFVEVEEVSETAERIAEAKRAFADAPEIQQWYYVTGKCARKGGHAAHRAMRACSAFERRPRCLGGTQRGGGTRCPSRSATLQQRSVMPAAIAGVRWVPSARVRLA